MSSISFNPGGAASGQISSKQAASGYKKQGGEEISSGLKWDSEAGSVSFSQDRYARAEAYSRDGKMVAGSVQSAKEQVRSAWKNTFPIITDSDDYGSVIGEPGLSDKAAEYYKQLKSKFGNLDFVLVGKDALQAAKANASRYGNSNHLVVLIDEEKLERMATDEDFRNKYEAIIAQAQSGAGKLSEAAKLNPSILRYGVTTDADGKTSFIAVCARSNARVSEKMAEKRAEKKAKAKADEKKAHRKEEEEKRRERIRSRREEEYSDEDKYEIISADSIEELIQKLEEYNQELGLTSDAETSGIYMDYQA